jgi:hypothetical protein
MHQPPMKPAAEWPGAAAVVCVTSREADPNRERKHGEQERCRDGRGPARQPGDEECASDDFSPREPSAENWSDGRGDEFVAGNDRREAPLATSQLGNTGYQKNDPDCDPRETHGHQRGFHRALLLRP